MNEKQEKALLEKISTAIMHGFPPHAPGYLVDAARAYLATLESEPKRRAERFEPYQVEGAIQAFLDYGEQSANVCHKGYFSGEGFAARCIRWHLAHLRERDERVRKLLAEMRDSTRHGGSSPGTVDAWADELEALK